MRGRLSLLSLVSIMVLTLIFTVTVHAQYSSPSYRVEETVFGTGGDPDSSSTNYRANQSAGALGVGAVSSNSYDAYAGFVTPNEPFLEMNVMNASVNFGTLDPAAYSYGAAQAGTCNCSFYVRTYNSSAYTVVTASDPPTQEGGFNFTGKPTQAVPSALQTVEEFGINLVANTTPAMGQNPNNLSPDTSFADGKAATGYEVANQFKYVKGDTIAQSPATAGNQAVGVTEYTISYIIKPNTITRAGVYKLNHDLVAVPTY